MLKIGIRAHDVTKSDIETLAKKISDAGFEYIQLVLQKAISNDDGLLTKEKAIYYKQIFDKYNIKIAMLGAYFNPIHSDKNKVEASINKFKNHLQYAAFLDTKYVGSETGSYNDDKWTYHIDNHKEPAFNKVYETFNALADYAKEFNTNIAIEAAYNHTIGFPDKLKCLLDKINNQKENKNAYAIIDLYNYLNYENYQSEDEIFDHAINLLKERTVIFHLKDYIVDHENKKLIQVGLGQGNIDFKQIIKKIKKLTPDAYLIFEGVVGEDIKTSKELIEKLIQEENENGN